MVLGLSLLSYVGAVAIGGNGFVAAFVGGLLFGASTSSRMHEPVEFTETVGLFASFFVWTVFGALFVGPVITGDIEPVAILYAVISLTVVRMVPVAAALAGTGLRRDTVAFMGWFGPRGLASVVFTLIAVEDLHGAGPIADVIVELATWTILLSVVGPRALGRPPGAHLRPSLERGWGHTGAGRGARAADPAQKCGPIGSSGRPKNHPCRGA